MINVGTKYQNYDNDELILYRVTGAKESDKGQSLRLKNITKGTETFCSDDYINNNLVKIEPDAIINFMITKYPESDEKDVYVWVFKADAIAAGKQEPQLIMRQDVYSYLKNPLAMDGKIYVGDCLTEQTMPTDDKLMSVCEFEDVIYSYVVNAYLNDTLDDILSLIRTSALKKFDDTFETLSKKNSPMVIGYCRNLKEFMTLNNFIDGYRLIFNINTIDFPIVLGKESYNSEGDIILNRKQHTRIEDMLRKYIKNVKVIEYDHDLDISQIIAYKHVLVSDSDQKIYLIAFEIVGDFPIPDDIAKAMNVRN